MGLQLDPSSDQCRLLAQLNNSLVTLRNMSRSIHFYPQTFNQTPLFASIDTSNSLLAVTWLQRRNKRLFCQQYVPQTFDTIMATTDDRLSLFQPSNLFSVRFTITILALITSVAAVLRVCRPFIALYFFRNFQMPLTPLV